MHATSIAAKEWQVRHWSSIQNNDDVLFPFSRDSFGSQVKEVMRKWFPLTDPQLVVPPHCFRHRGVTQRFMVNQISKHDLDHNDRRKLITISRCTCEAHGCALCKWWWPHTGGTYSRKYMVASRNSSLRPRSQPDEEGENPRRIVASIRSPRKADCLKLTPNSAANSRFEKAAQGLLSSFLWLGKLHYVWKKSLETEGLTKIAENNVWLGISTDK